MKKTFAIIAGFALLLIIFLFTEKKQENLKEEILWKINPTKISLFPPKNGKEFEGNFINERIDFVRYANLLKDTALFSISSIDKETGRNIVFECGYHCKNLFTEVSVLKILSAVFSEESYRKNLNIDADSSSIIALYNNDKILKELLIGKESSDKARRFFEIDGKIYSAHSYIFNRFKDYPQNFRERQIFSTVNSKMKNMEFVSENKTVKIQVAQITENSIEKNSYVRTSQKKIIIEPLLGDSLEASLKSLKIELYPDDKNGEGFSVANELTKSKENFKLKIILTNNIQVTLRIFPMTNIKDVKLRPIVRQLQDITESPAYIKEEDFKKIEEDFEKIFTAESYKKPNAKTEPTNTKPDPKK